MEHGIGHVEALDRAVAAFVQQLRRSGVRHAVISPGSRSTPLTLALVRDGEIRPWLHIDERAAGYFALGLARERREPVALVCTSGTAAANYLPAVVEASLSRVPLLVLTADRPPELREVGANQVIDQVRLYGSHAKWFVELPAATGASHIERHARMTAARAASLAIEAPAGPVHVNLPFREPLSEYREQPLEVDAGATEVLTGPRTLDERGLDALAQRLSGRRGLLVCGPETFGLPAAEIAALAAALDWPVLADPLSGVRAGPHDRSRVVDCYDLLLREPAFAAAHAPEVVLRFGAVPTSKPLFQYLGDRLPNGQVIVDGGGGWRDQEFASGLMVHADERQVALALRERVRPAQEGWCAGWLEAARVARAAIAQALDGLDEPFEGRVPVEVAGALPRGGTLVSGNSMPPRDLDAFLPSLAQPLRVVGTRGASGIDGVTSGAAGAAAARLDGVSGPVVLVTGDLSFVHDLTGLWPAYRYGLDLTVVLVNNDGGGIFHLLPQAEALPDVFEQWWGTPHGLDVRGAVGTFGGSLERLDGARGWAEPIAAAVAAGGLRVLELRTDRERNVALHRAVAAAVVDAVAGASAPAAGGVSL